MQRQYSTVLGRKVNCQIAVALHYLSPAGFHPLAMRLYLPRRWLEDAPRLDAAEFGFEGRDDVLKPALADILTVLDGKAVDHSTCP